MKAIPTDQTGRNRFATELDRNFSVIAAAGTGKTAAITERILEIAQKNADWLPRLVVVTFTNRAADEMQQRTRQRIFEAGVPLPVLAKFNRAFFGTIHSFCTKLLAAHGYLLGLPSRLEVISDDDELWSDFVQHTDSIGESLSSTNRKKLLRHVQLRDLMELGRRGNLPLVLEERNVACPKAINIADVINYRGAGVLIDADKKALRKWKGQFESGSDFLPLIEWKTKSRSFVEHRQRAFRAFNEWLSCCALKVAAEVQAKYRQFRAAHGLVTFDDQIALALQLTQNTKAISSIRNRDYIVILDEAQDTDPKQFEILLEITRPPNAGGHWINHPAEQPPRPGRFCMVGDFQQSIYGDRADLKHYRLVHDALLKSRTAEKLAFSVTFRLDQKQIDFVNSCFQDIFNERDGQVGFIQLEPRPQKLPGQVIRLDVTPGTLSLEAHDKEKAKAEAQQLANWLKKAGLDNLRARAWDNVAILCPRKNWFPPIADALRRVGIDLQIQSETEVKGDSPAHAWFTALLTVMTQPRNGFEIVGVLREVFGISDHDLAIFSDGHGDRFQIERETGGSGIVARTLDLLARVHLEVADKPLFAAVHKIIEATQLRARLETLPAEDFDNLDHEFDVLVQSAAAVEAEGLTLEEFAELLRANFPSEREAGAPRAGAIQLITSQKAKGLEWDTVIVPFFSRKIHTREDQFPRLILDPERQELTVAFSKADLPIGTKDALKKALVHEMERLLYVALTRARHTLVLAVDRELFGSAPTDSLTKWFRSDQGEPNERHMVPLPQKAIASRETQSYHERAIRAQERPDAIANLPEPALDIARSRASQFLRRLNPSRFQPAQAEIERPRADQWKETESEFRARTLPSAATRYGVWWHEFIQKIPWNSKPSSWEAVFDANVIDSPDPARSRREWKLLGQYFSTRRDFPGGNIFPEMPFFWRIDEQKCLEGIVDLALYDSGEKKWFILDWKTNRIERDEIGNLENYYRPQIAGYWKAVGEITKQPVTAGIYSTATGELVGYDEEDLEQEWARLQSLGADEFAAETGRAGCDPISEPSGQLEFPQWCE